MWLYSTFQQAYLTCLARAFKCIIRLLGINISTDHAKACTNNPHERSELVDVCKPDWGCDTIWDWWSRELFWRSSYICRRKWVSDQAYFNISSGRGLQRISEMNKCKVKVVLCTLSPNLPVGIFYLEQNHSTFQDGWLNDVVKFLKVKFHTISQHIFIRVLN